MLPGIDPEEEEDGTHPLAVQKFNLNSIPTINYTYYATTNVLQRNNKLNGQAKVIVSSGLGSGLDSRHWLTSATTYPPVDITSYTYCVLGKYVIS